MSHRAANRNGYLVCPLTSLALLLTALAPYAGQAAEPHFQAQTIDNRVQIGYGIAIGPVDADSHPDILLADKTEIVWYRNPGSTDGSWQRHVMARNLTPRDNVCLAARDLDGDGQVEVAVGANWNPGETHDPTKSGALFFLRRPDDPTQAWTVYPITPHDPTVHRMHWVRLGKEDDRLVVLPLHGIDNQGGEGVPVRVQAYRVATDAPTSADPVVLDASMHMTHNFDVVQGAADEPEWLLVAGREGIKRVAAEQTQMLIENPPSRGAGEVRACQITTPQEIVAIEPMHGTEVVYYQRSRGEGTAPAWRRVVLDGTLNQGHALAAGDLLGQGRDQIVAGWRNPNQQNRVGIKLYVARDAQGQQWETHLIDDNQMACEDLQLADLNGDGKLDIVAAGRATNNLVVYWNHSQHP